MMNKCLYMHTLDGMPAAYDGRHICYWYRRVPLVATLKQIRKEQAASKEWRRKQGYGDSAKYGYVTIKVSK